MAIERLKFRCYRCNQLLGATPNKAGSVVTCPKCSAELLIPVPELRTDESSEVQPKAPAPSRAKPRAEPRTKAEPDVTASVESTAVATAVQTVSKPRPCRRRWPSTTSRRLPPDLIDLKPEDLRVEAEFFESLARQPPAPVAERAPWPPPEVLEARHAPKRTLRSRRLARSWRPPSFRRPPRRCPAAGSTETVDLSPARVEPLAPPPVPQRAEAALIGASIEIEHPTILPPGTEIRRVREVVLPASVVLSWSLFVLLGIALSFVAGLLMGHFSGRLTR